MRVGVRAGRQSSQASSHRLILAVSSSLKSRRDTLSYTTQTARDESSRLHLANSIRWAIATAGLTSSPASSGRLDLPGFYFTTVQLVLAASMTATGRVTSDLLRTNTPDWRTSWTHIVAGRFVASSPYSSLFFYSAIENYGEIWATDGKGLAGHSSYQVFSNYLAGAVTHILAGDFHWTPGFIDSGPNASRICSFTTPQPDKERCTVAA